MHHLAMVTGNPPEIVQAAAEQVLEDVELYLEMLHGEVEAFPEALQPYAEGSKAKREKWTPVSSPMFALPTSTHTLHVRAPKIG